MEKKIEYSNSEIAIIWKPGLCSHSGNCVRSLPAVYKPAEKRWIQPENATTQELIEQIGRCPSGALSYRKIVE